MLHFFRQVTQVGESEKAERQTDKRTDKETDRWTDRQTHWQIGKNNKNELKVALKLSKAENEK